MDEKPLDTVVVDINVVTESLISKETNLISQQKSKQSNTILIGQPVLRFWLMLMVKRDILLHQTD